VGQAKAGCEKSAFAARNCGKSFGAVLAQAVLFFKMKIAGINPALPENDPQRKAGSHNQLGFQSRL